MCVFCDIIEGKIPSKVVYEDDKVLAILDISQVTYGHTIVMPKKHVRNILEADDETVLDCMRVAKKLAAQIVKNAQALAATLIDRGFNLVTGGTDNHLMLIDLTNKGVTGKIAAKALDAAGIVLNYNAVPYDTRKPFDPSGIRLGSAAVTSRGFKEEQMVQTGRWIDAIISNPTDITLQNEIAAAVRQLCFGFPAPGLEQL